MDHVLPLVFRCLVPSMYDFLCLSCLFFWWGSKAVHLDSLSLCLGDLVIS